MTEDEMVGWHHGLNGHGFEQTPGVGDGQGSLVCYSPQSKESNSPQVAKRQTRLSNSTELTPALSNYHADQSAAIITEQKDYDSLKTQMTAFLSTNYILNKGNLYINYISLNLLKKKSRPLGPQLLRAENRLRKVHSPKGQYIP